MAKHSSRSLSLSRRQILILLFAGFSVCLLISIFSLYRAVSGQRLDKYLDFFIFLFLAAVCLCAHAALTNRYRCPRCQTVFRPSFKREFLEGNFLVHRRLTCPTCGRFGLCHSVPLSENVPDLIDQVPQGKPAEEERKWKERRQAESEAASETSPAVPEPSPSSDPSPEPAESFPNQETEPAVDPTPNSQDHPEES